MTKKALTSIRESVASIPVFRGSSSSKLKSLSKDSFENTICFAKSELEGLKKRVLLPFFDSKKAKAGLKNTTLDIVPNLEKADMPSLGELNIPSNKVNISEELLTSPDFGKLVNKKTGKVVYLPMNPKYKNAQIPCVDRMAGLKERAGYFSEDVAVRPLTRSDRINFTKANIIHELSHADDTANSIKVAGLDEVAAGYNHVGLTEKFKDSWKYLKDTEKTIPLDSPLGKRLIVINEHRQKLAKAKGEKEVAMLYMNSPEEIRAVCRQFLSLKKLGV